MGALASVIGGFIVQLIARLAPMFSKKALVVAFLASYLAVVLTS